MRTLRKVAPVAHGIYLTTFIIVSALALTTLVVDFRKDAASVSAPTPTKTESYMSHGKTLYISPELLWWAGHLEIASSIIIATLAGVAVIFTFVAKRAARRKAS